MCERIHPLTNQFLLCEDSSWSEGYCYLFGIMQGEEFSFQKLTRYDEIHCYFFRGPYGGNHFTVDAHDLSKAPTVGGKSVESLQDLHDLLPMNLRGQISLHPLLR